MRYPEAERQPIVDELYGHRVPDPYRWLEDPANPATIRWQSAQDELWHAHVRALPSREQLAARIAELSSVGTVTVPTWRDDRYFFLRRDPRQEHAVLYVSMPDGTDATLLDPVALDPSGTLVLDHWQPDPTGRLVTVQLSRAGTERAQLYVIDVDAQQGLDGPIDRVRYSPIGWLADSSGFFYVRGLSDESPARRVYLHRLGAAPDDDVMVFGAGRDDATSYGLGMSADGRWLTVSAAGGTAAANDIYLADLSEGSPARPTFVPVQENAPGQTVANVGPDGRLYVVTNVDAPSGRLCTADPSKPGPEHWTELVRVDPDAVLADFAILDGSALDRPLLVVATTRHAAASVTIHDRRTGEQVGEIPLPGHGTISSFAARSTDAHEVWFGYTDHVTPDAVFRYDARTGETTRWAETPGAVELPIFETHELTCTSKDGTSVRMVVLAKAGTTGPMPTILYGYGGFGVSLAPTYSSFTLAWVEAGGAFAAVQLRGGGEQGADWHRAGTRDQKQNVFDDFVAAAEQLITAGWTTPQRLACCGESNGGLLVGAAITQRPDLFAAAACSSPLLDMVRYERSGLGPSWRAEYGSASDPEQLGWLLGYSPYHHVSPGVDYPAVLFTVADGDTRVDPAHARKMCAALQWATGSDRPVLLRREHDTGHGARAVSTSVTMAADLLAFLAQRTGLS